MSTGKILSITPFLFLCLGVCLCPAAEVAGSDGGEGLYTPTRMQLLLADGLDLSRWKTDTGLDKVINLPRGKGNAAKYYAKLSGWYKKEKAEKGGRIRYQYDNLAGKPSAEYQQGGIGEILAAAEIKKCRLVPEYFKPMVNRNLDMPDAKVVLAYIDALKRCALALEKAARYAEAERLYRAIIVMGWHFTEDRPNLAVYSLGLTIQRIGCEEFAPYLIRQLQMERARRCDEYKKFLRKIYKAVDHKNRRFLNQWARFYSLTACIRCAARDAEPLWRQEAALNLAVMQNGYPDSNGEFRYHDQKQQKAARAALQKMAVSDPQENIRKLAKWCLEEMTPDNIHNWKKAGK